MDSTDSTATPTEGQTGQAVTAPDQGQAVHAPVSQDSGQVTVPEGTTVQDSARDGYDYGKMTPEEVHKHWQREYTRKSQELSEVRKQLEPWTQIQQNPLPAIQQYLQQYGYEITRAGQNTPDDPYAEPGQHQPQVDQRMLLSQMQNYIQQQIAPIQESIQQQTMNTVVSELNTHFPDWQSYEGPIKDNLSKYPNLAYDIEGLYNMSVPPKVRESRMYQKFLNDQRNRQNLSTTEPAKSTAPIETPEESTAGDWHKSWEYAKRKAGLK